MDRNFIYFDLVALLFFTLLATSGARAFEVNSHEKLSLRTVDPAVTGASNLDRFLRQVLRHEFEDGVQQSLNGRAVQDWIGFGSKEEDSPFWRVQAHFHDPNKTWDQAGTLGVSSVIWSQLLNQDDGVGGGNHSWQDARESYYRALTGTDLAQRQQDWADTFQGLGHLIHLVQDAATPSHTRNDLHLSYWGIGDTDRLHVWGESVLGLAEVDNSSSQRYDASILNLPPNNFAPIPIARIIDTEKLRAGVPSEGLDIGVAEYSNANFFSDDTIFSPSYQTPTDLGLITEPGPNGKLTQYLYRHPSAVDTRYKLAVAGPITDSVTLPAGQIQWELDDFVMKDYGKKLFPRAIGYSAGLIDYFFRGKVDSNPSAVADYLWTQWDQRPNSIRVDGVSVGADDGNEQGGQGTMRLVLYLRGTDVDPASESIPPVVVSHPVSVSASSTPQTVVFPFDALPFPQTFPELGTFSAEYWASIVYRGPLGQEADAVAVGGHCFDPTDGSKYNWRYDFEHLHGYNPFEGGGGPDVHIAYIAWC
jgi:hypothetical protein